MRKFYLIAAGLGLLLPYLVLALFLRENGFDLVLFAEQMFASNVATFFVMDVLISSVVLWIFIFTEGRKVGMQNLWVYVLANLLVGVSFALPLFLYVREGHLSQAKPVIT